MKLGAIVFFLLLIHPAVAQAGQAFDGLAERLPADTLVLPAGNSEADTLLSHYSTSLQYVHSAEGLIDSINTACAAQVNKVEKAMFVARTQIDSLKQLLLPDSVTRTKIDSVRRVLAGTWKDAASHLDKINEKVDLLTKSGVPVDIVSQHQQTLNALAGKVQSGPLSEGMAILDLSALPAVPGSVADNLPLPQLDALPAGLNSSTDLARLNVNVADNLPVGTSIPSIDPNAAEQLAVSEVTKFADVSALEAGTQSLPLSGDLSEETVKQELITNVRTAAMNHFGGRETEVRAAMNELATFKNKYASVANTAEVLKKDKRPTERPPFIERLRPEIMLQPIKRTDAWAIEISSFIGYKITRRLTAGPGWSQRFTYTIDKNTASSPVTLWGPRTFVEYTAWKGFSPRLEAEYLRRESHDQTAGNADPTAVNWLWDFAVGVKKDYTIFRRLKGSACVMTRPRNLQRSELYGAPVAMRIGFQMEIKKRRSKRSGEVKANTSH